MFLTIFEILVTLLALFKLFGWKLGIVEAISLSILVGNSLDYCIHLTEGYLATDSRHIAFVESFKVRNNDSINKLLTFYPFGGKVSSKWKQYMET